MFKKSILLVCLIALFASLPGTCLAGISDYDPPTISAFTLPATANSRQVAITSFAAADNAGGSGISAYCLTENSQQVNDVGRKTVYVTLSISGLPSNSSLVGLFDISIVLPSGVVPLRLAAADVNEDAINSVSWVSSDPKPDMFGASFLRGTNELWVQGGYVTNGTKAGKLFTIALNAPNDRAINSGTVAITLNEASDPNYTAYPGAVLSMGEILENTTQCPAWLATVPDAFVFSDIPQGVPTKRTLYAFVMDVTGNVSVSKSATTTMTLPETTPPVITSFRIASSSMSATVPIIDFMASDNLAVTGYCLTESDNSAGCQWSSVKPTSYTFNGLGENIYTKSIAAYVRDAAGNVSNQAAGSVQITIDTTKPVLNVSTLTDGSYTRNPSLNISGSVADATSGVQSLKINGEDVEVAVSGSFSTVRMLVPGVNTITVTAVDRAGNMSSVERSITYDDSLPTLTVDAPADNTSTATALLDITGVINGVTTAHVVVNLNDTTDHFAQIQGDSFSDSVMLTAGINTIEITVTDVANKTNTVKRTIIYDPNSPELSIVFPLEDKTDLRVDTIVVRGEVNSLSNVSVTLTVSGTVYTPAVVNGQFSQPITFAAEGRYPITITATNDVAATTTVVRNIFYTKGRIFINKGAGYTASTKVAVDVDFSDPAASMQFFYNNKSWSKPVPYQSGSSIPLTLPGGDGIKQVHARFLDASGNQVGSTYSAAIILDSTLPAGAISIENGAAVVSTANVNLKLPAADINGIAGMALLTDGSSAWPASCSQYTAYDPAPVVALPPGDGLKTVTVRFCDTAGNVSPVYSDTIQLSGSWQPPVTLGGYIVINGGEVLARTAGVKLAVTNPGSFPYMSFSLDGVKWTGWETFKSLKKLTLPAGDGQKRVFARFADSAKQTDGTLYEGGITLDTKPPVGGISIKGGAYAAATNTDVVISLAAADVNGVSEMLVSYDPAQAASWEPFATRKTVTLPAGAGVKKVSVRFRDPAGNMSKVYSDSIVLSAQ